MCVRGIRGATTVEENSAELIRAATKELLQALIAENSISLEDVISALFTVTPDLNAYFPASSAREIGWERVPMICATEIPVPGAIQLCIRILLHVNTSLNQKEIKHVYLHKAASLRMDLVT